MVIFDLDDRNRYSPCGLTVNDVSPCSIVVMAMRDLLPRTLRTYRFYVEHGFPHDTGNSADLERRHAKGGRRGCRSPVACLFAGCGEAVDEPAALNGVPEEDHLRDAVFGADRVAVLLGGRSAVAGDPDGRDARPAVLVDRGQRGIKLIGHRRDGRVPFRVPVERARVLWCRVDL